jgi:hypothetical protein
MSWKSRCMTLIFLFAGGCSNMQIEDYQQVQPEFILEEYFLGKTQASGLFEDRFGNIQRQFTVSIEGTWDGTNLVMTEDFVYSDGETEQRIWTLRKTGKTTYEGESDNVIGKAVGERAGNAFNWTYDFNLKVGDGFWKVRFDDWMFLQPDGVMLNKAVVTRWGIKLGTVFLSFKKEPVTPSVATESS